MVMTHPITISVETDLEVCFINFILLDLTFKLGVVYRPRTFNRNINQNLHNSIINQLWNADRFCVLGDFNFTNNNWNTLTSSISEEKHFVELVLELNKIQRVRDPSRVHNSLDLCLSLDEDTILNVGVKSNFLTSDQSFLTLDINSPVKIEPSRQGFQRCYLRAVKCSSCYHHWYSHFKSYDNDCNGIYTIFQYIIDDLIDQYVPIKAFSRGNVPWFTPALKRLVRTKQRKFNKYINNPNICNFTEYKNYYNFFKNAIS